MISPETLQLINAAKEAIRFDDNADANRALFGLRKFLSSPQTSHLDQKEQQELSMLETYLKVVAFSCLKDEESADVLQHHYLESFVIDAPMEPKLTAKLFMVPFPVRGEMRELFRRALIENDQKLGPITVGQWIKEYLKNFTEDKRTEASIVQFINENSQARMLNVQEKNRLKGIIHIYTYYLIYTLPTKEPYLSQMIEDFSGETPESADRLSASGRMYTPSAPVNTASAKVELPLNEALKKYPDLGEQIITSYKITLKMFPEPARPSIKNWISDYTFNVGYNNQDSLVRSNYLFQNPNAKSLSATDRNKLSYVLKAFDENSVVSINPQTMQIVFPETAPQNRPALPRSETPRNEPAPSYRPVASRHVENTDMARKNISPSSMRQTSMKFNPLGTPSHRPVYEFKKTSEPIQPNFRQPIEKRERNESFLSIKPDAPHKINSNTRQESAAFRPSRLEEKENLPALSRISSPNITAPVIPKNELINFSRRPDISPKSAREIRPASPVSALAQIQTPDPQKNINFSSPQKMSHEKIAQAPKEAPKTPETQAHPYRISYAREENNQSSTPRSSQPLPKNVIDLRE